MTKIEREGEREKERESVRGRDRETICITKIKEKDCVIKLKMMREGQTDKQKDRLTKSLMGTGYDLHAGKTAGLY